MASAMSEQKKCGVCSRLITAGYLTFGDYCGTTVCMQCLSKNTWSMCRKCNGTLIDYPQSPATSITVIPEDLTSAGVSELFDTNISKLRAELTRIEDIHKLAEDILHSASMKKHELKTAIEIMEHQSQTELIAKLRKEARDIGHAGYFALIPIDEAPDSPQKLEQFRKPITVDYIDRKNEKHKLKLFPGEKRLRVRVNDTKTYKMDAEYAEIIARSGEACEIALMQSHICGPVCVAIKTQDNLVHILYCEDIKYPYKSSRYIDYVSVICPLSSVKLELSDLFCSVMKDWEFIF
jgi:hypothetical protein